MSSRTVSTKCELEEAKNSRVDEIIVTGDLADKLHRAKKITYMSAGVIAILAVAIAAVPVTGGLSAVMGVAPVAAMTGLEIAAIIAAASIGLGLLMAIYKEYDEITYSNGKITLRRKH